eukprot:748811-Hanusia_phi.AAC.4
MTWCFAASPGRVLPRAFPGFWRHQRCYRDIEEAREFRREGETEARARREARKRRGRKAGKGKEGGGSRVGEGREHEKGCEGEEKEGERGK